MRTPKEFILSLLSREVERACRTRDDALELRDQAMDKSASTSRILDRAFKEIDVLTEVAEHWRKEANAKQQLFSDIVKEVDGAESLHNLQMVVRDGLGGASCRTGAEKAPRDRTRKHQHLHESLPVPGETLLRIATADGEMQNKI